MLAFRRLLQSARPPPATRLRSLCSAEMWVPGEPDINITTRCAERIIEINDRKPETVCLRVSVEPGGCSGFQYKFALEPASLREEEDTVFRVGGAEVVVDEASLDLLRGATVDFEEDMMRSAFVIAANPQSEGGCGCGASFAPKD
mmetsp:Transcript_19652/g.65013  ORF Transcript_19652/g.65013 Transcript_19652/m.65013 type:complete len:145 (-) Transcript_19652:287-721(-)|eukprot:CAMPEP_0185339318 /NCGR_PEP_ID=MMETSP1363-20130426/97563_1 /TAXON_ID=38817 /ORGANISM="Gephyrocapsa oceanica, Strain RCC1303" /LENGTH=144 /DNA_ID=CAMNT_0027938543 /DNA_START=468 /DNA_END=902 /DNA_ORIENTATION=-